MKPGCQYGNQFCFTAGCLRPVSLDHQGLDVAQHLVEMDQGVVVAHRLAPSWHQLFGNGGKSVRCKPGLGTIQPVHAPAIVGPTLLQEAVGGQSWFLGQITACVTPGGDRVAQRRTDRRLEHSVPATIAVGTQWGDEGKGRVVDVIAKEATMVVRYQGGHNAGHTLVVDGETFALQLIPSGVLYDFVTPVIANGVVVDPQVMLDEIAKLEGKGVDCSKLKVSSHCHLVMPYHQALDELSEARLGDAKLGTTKRGIGPAYADKASRLGVRMEHLAAPDTFRSMVRAALLDKNPILRDVHGHPGFDPDEVADHFLNVIAPEVLPYVADTVGLVHDALDRGERLLFEGAQATFLDVDHGTYPFVTSSNPTAGFASTGAGVGPGAFDQIIGITKAYVTRVGGGPFVTELLDDTGDKLVDLGREYGVNTGRRRRPGWFDAVMGRQAVRLNGCTELALTKIDILDTFETIKVCVAYEIDGVEYRHMPDRFADLERARPVYVELPGWLEDLSDIREASQLPQRAVEYIKFLETQVGAPIKIVCVGPGREQYVVRQP